MEAADVCDTLELNAGPLGKATVEKKYSYLPYPSTADGQTAEMSLERLHLFSAAN